MTTLHHQRGGSQHEAPNPSSSRSSLDSDNESGATTDTSSRRISMRIRTPKQTYEPEDFLGHQTETPRSASPSKRRAGSISRLQQTIALPRGGIKSGIDGLALLLMACELLDKNQMIGTDGIPIQARVPSMLEGTSRGTMVPIDANVIIQNTSPFADQRFIPSASAASRSPTKKSVSPQKSRSASPRKRGDKPIGPCTNPHCMNPNESPQWRRGPPEAPVLCNACGTRWIRNKSLVPIVPQRGIRYGKDGNPNRSPIRSRNRSTSKSASPSKSIQTTLDDVSQSGELIGAETSIGTEKLSLELSSDKSSKSVTGARVVNLVACVNGFLTGSD